MKLRRGPISGLALDVVEVLFWLLVIGCAVVVAGLLNAIGWPG